MKVSRYSLFSLFSRGNLIFYTNKYSIKKQTNNKQTNKQTNRQSNKQTNMSTYSFTKGEMVSFFKKVEEEFSGTGFSYEDLMNMHEMPKLAKKAKKAKDPNAPKKALAAWIFFTSDKRSKLKEEYPDKNMIELTTVMSQMWKECSGEDKAPYQMKAAEDKVRFKQEMDKYKSGSESSESSDSESDQKVEKAKKEKKEKKEKDPNAPKKNLNMYMHFCKDYRSKHSDVKVTGGVLKTIWADIEDKAPYEKMRDDDKVRYLKEKKEYDDSQ